MRWGRRGGGRGGGKEGEKRREPGKFGLLVNNHADLADFGRRGQTACECEERLLTAKTHAELNRWMIGATRVF